jgi:Tol biopolymer transport system component
MRAPAVVSSRKTANRRTMRRIPLLAVVLAVALGVYGGCDESNRERASAGSPSGATGQSAGRMIAFTRSEGSFEHRLGEIYVMKPDGSDQANLTDTPRVSEAAPAWSPDGTRLAFTRFEDEQESDIHVMNVDGSGLTNLTDTPYRSENTPTWSPDAQRIAYTGEGPDIYVMKADGSGQINLTDSPDASDAEPAWSPDGKRILFIRARRRNGEGSAAIYVMNADGSDERRLPGGPDLDEVIPSSPAFSPDGQRIAFLGLRKGDPDPMVWVMNADGSNASPLPGARSGLFSSPTFSPDGGRMAFEGIRDGPGIYVMRSDGSGQLPLTENVPNDGEPAWSPVLQ